jgi:hypothetical protein
MNYIDEIDGYKIYKPNKKLKRKIYLGGMYAVILSRKAIKVLYERFKVINNISDIYLCDIIYDIKKDFSDNIMIKTDYNLNTLIIQEDLFKVDLLKPSLTEDKYTNNLSLLLDSSSIKYLSKIKKLHFLIKQLLKTMKFVINMMKILIYALFVY